MIDLRIDQTKKLIAYFAAAVIAGLILFLTWSNFEKLVYLTVPKIPPPQLLTNENSKLAPKGLEVTIATKEENYFNKGIVYRSENKKPLAVTKAKELALKIGFTNEPQKDSEKLLFWEMSGKTLRINLELEILDYSQNLTPSQVKSGKISTKEEAIKKFKSFYKNLGLKEYFFDVNQPIVIYSDELSNFTDGHDQEKKVNPAVADLITLTYPLKVEEEPIFSLYPTQYKIEAIFGRNNELINIKIPLILEDWEPYLEYPPLKEDGIKKSLSDGKATLVEYTPLIFKSSLTKDPLSKMSITRISKVYLKSKGEYTYLLPGYILEGEGDTINAQRIKVSFYLPAISNQFFK